MSSNHSDDAERRRMSIVLRRLRRAYPDAGIALHFGSPWELLVATVLSAQCTDERVNQVTPGLFARYPDVDAFAAASQEELARAVYRTGYHNQKARALRGAAMLLVERYHGEVRGSSASSSSCPGWAGRPRPWCSATPTAGTGIAVDTHVGRIVRRLGFTTETDAVKVERRLLELVPRRTWTLLTHLFIAHGRAVCQSRTPRCRTACCCRSARRARRGSRVALRHRIATLGACGVTRRSRRLAVMDRLDLELYADRLARHADRLSDDLEAARLRMSWAVLEQDARAALGARRTALLEAVGVMADDGTSDDDAALIARRRQQLGALEALQAHVEMRIAELVKGS